MFKTFLFLIKNIITLHFNTNIPFHLFIHVFFFMILIYVLFFVGWFPRDGFLIEKEQIDKIRHLPTIIVQGRYDVVCPCISAYDLKQVRTVLYCTVQGVCTYDTYFYLFLWTFFNFAFLNTFFLSTFPHLFIFTFFHLLPPYLHYFAEYFVFDRHFPKLIWG